MPLGDGHRRIPRPREGAFAEGAGDVAGADKGRARGMPSRPWQTTFAYTVVKKMKSDEA